MMTVSVQTLGCKLNQLESEAIAEAFAKEGFRVVSRNDVSGADAASSAGADADIEAGADLYIINTCTVTSKAEQKARRMIRKAYRDFPLSCVIITGCYAQLKSAELEHIDIQNGNSDFRADAQKRIFVVSGDKKSGILDLPNYIMQSLVSPWELPFALKHWIENDTVTFPHGRFRFNANSFSSHSRAFLKIQDGCNNACTFCAVHLARGKSVSLASEELLVRLRTLEEKGFGEAVLTGVNINQYDDGKNDFPSLLNVLLEGTNRVALRLSSIEPDLITPPFLESIKHSRIRPHFHLSVQSGSDAVLKAMGRRYTADHVLKAVEKLREAKDDPFLACDIISGFPGEDDKAFAETYTLCEEAAFSWVHAFPYSPRPETAAARLPNRIPERTAVFRVQRLISLAEKGRSEYIKRNIGRQLDVIIEDNTAESTGALSVGLTENYLRASIQHSGAKTLKPGTTVRCRIISPYTRSQSDDSRIDVTAELND